MYLERERERERERGRGRESERERKIIEKIILILRNEARFTV